MKKQIALGVVAALTGIIGFASYTSLSSFASSASQIHSPKPTAQQPLEKATGIGMTALQQAAKDKKFLYLFVYEKNDEQTRTLRKKFEETIKKLDAHWGTVDKNAPDEQAFAKKYRLANAPTPFILVLAPNGAITGGYQEVSEARFRRSMVSPGMQDCLKALQDQKIILICLQNHSTKQNEAAMRGVDEFMGDSQLGANTVVIKIDPADPAEQSFIARLRIDQVQEEALTLLLTPPGSLIASFKGATTKQDFVDAMKKAAARAQQGPGPRRQPQ